MSHLDVKRKRVRKKVGAFASPARARIWRVGWRSPRGVWPSQRSRYPDRRIEPPRSFAEAIVFELSRDWLNVLGPIPQLQNPSSPEINCHMLASIRAVA